MYTHDQKFITICIFVFFQYFVSRITLKRGDEAKTEEQQKKQQKKHERENNNNNNNKTHTHACTHTRTHARARARMVPHTQARNDNEYRRDYQHL